MLTATTSSASLASFTRSASSTAICGWQLQKEAACDPGRAGADFCAACTLAGRARRRRAKGERCGAAARPTAPCLAAHLAERVHGHLDIAEVHTSLRGLTGNAQACERQHEGTHAQRCRRRLPPPHLVGLDPHSRVVVHHALHGHQYAARHRCKPPSAPLGTAPRRPRCSSWRLAIVGWDRRRGDAAR